MIELLDKDYQVTFDIRAEALRQQAEIGRRLIALMCQRQMPGREYVEGTVAFQYPLSLNVSWRS